MPYTEVIRVRYNECDMQNVVFNANYWMYADDAVAQFVRHAIAVETGVTSDSVNFADVGFDFMLKTAQGTWHKGATYGDIIHATCAVSRWGRTSFDVAVQMSVREEPVFDCVITYVSTTPGAPKPVEVPDMIRRALDRSF
jgi:acyl-CoA thioester hydrolase